MIISVKVWHLNKNIILTCWDSYLDDSKRAFGIDYDLNWHLKLCSQVNYSVYQLYFINIRDNN